MQTTPTFDAIHELVTRRNMLLDGRDSVRAQLRSTLPNPARRQQLELEYWHLVGMIDGIGQALEALRDAGERVGSAEYLVIEARRQSA